MKYEEMTVKELRELSRRNGLTLEHKGHKFTKPELIERLKQHDDVQADINKAIDEAGEEPVELIEENEEWDAPLLEENKVEEKAVKEQEKAEENNNDDYIRYAETIEQFEKKYGARKKDYIYKEILGVGSFVVFVEYVQALNGEIYKKLRTAKVVRVSWKREVVRVEKPFGDIVDLDFNQLLYIREEGRTYPKDVRDFLYKQREQNKERRLKYECNKLNKHFN